MNVVIFGGSGFVGAHYARHLLEAQPDSNILICDHTPLDRARFSTALLQVLDSPRCTFKTLDIRHPIPSDLFGAEPVDLIANFAAVHREPGHELAEYWETNIPGAEHITAYARQVGCRTLLFTSSISPYGPSDLPRDERSLPTPSTPYGCSKLVAEKIHLAWQSEASDRRLVIARPGVVFGAGEGGNVTRMVKFLRRGLFVYLGNREVRKSGIFVKELCRIFDWAIEGTKSESFCNVRPGACVVNCSYDPPPSVEEYVTAIRAVGGFTRPVLSAPYRMLHFLSHFTMGLGGVHPVRMRKLVRPNLILPTFLREKGYPWYWSFQASFEDWRKERPTDWAA